MHTTNIAVIGGGLVGSITAIGLASAGVATTLIDRDDLSLITNAEYDGRTLALSYGSRLILEQWNLWQALQHYVQPIEEIRVTNGDGKGYIHYDGQQTAAHPMGYIIEIRHFRQILLDRLNTLTSCTLKAPCTVKSLQPDVGKIIIELDGSALETQLVIGADGRHSMVRKSIGIQPVQWSYDQTAIVCVVKHAQPHYDCAFELFQPTGPLALLPMTEQRSSLIWTLPTAIASTFIQLCDDEFNDELQRRFGDSLGTLCVEGRRWSYVLEGAYCRNWFKGRAVLVGDACHAIHPVAGQGFNLGLRDADVLVNKIIQANHRGQDIGAPSLLASYQRQRRFDSLSMTIMTDGLVRLFSNHSSTLKMARGIGMHIINKLTPIKKILTRQAMGLPFI